MVAQRGSQTSNERIRETQGIDIRDIHTIFDIRDSLGGYVGSQLKAIMWRAWPSLYA